MRLNSIFECLEKESKRMECNVFKGETKANGNAASPLLSPVCELVLVDLSSGEPSAAE